MRQLVMKNEPCILLLGDCISLFIRLQQLTIAGRLPGYKGKLTGIVSMGSGLSICHGNNILWIQNFKFDSSFLELEYFKNVTRMEACGRQPIYAPIAFWVKNRLSHKYAGIVWLRGTLLQLAVASRTELGRAATFHEI